MIDTTSLWPTDPVRAIWQWGAIAGRLGIDYPLARPVVLAVRGVERFGKRSHPLVHSSDPDDAFAILAPNEPPLIVAGATHAFQRNSKASPDVDHDGLGDVGSIRPGHYLLNDLHNGEEVIFHITNPDGSDKLPAWRDFDHDGKLSPEEMQRSEDMRTGPQVASGGTYASSILLHGGLDEPPSAKHRYSIGCFTMPRQYRALISEKCRPYGGKGDLVLINAPELVEIVAGLPSIDDEPTNPRGSVA